MSDPGIELDPNQIIAAQGSKYQRIIGQLVEENAKLEAYISQLLTAGNTPPPSSE